MNDSHINDEDGDHTLAEECGGARVSLGALVLGSLEPQDRETIEAHVRDCRACSTTLSDLAPIAGLLNRVDTADLDPAPPPPELLERALAQVRAEDAAAGPLASAPRSRRRWAVVALGGAAAAGLLVVVALVWTNVAGNDSPTGPVAVSADPGATVSASVTMNPTETGTELAFSLTGVEPGEHCELVAVAKDGTREVAATWVATYDGEAHVTGTTGFALDDIATLEVKTPDGATLATLTVPPQ